MQFLHDIHNIVVNKYMHKRGHQKVNKLSRWCPTYIDNFCQKI